VAGVVEHVRGTLSDSRVTASLDGTHSSEPSPVSSTATTGFDAIASAVREVEPRALVAPSLVLGATDARHYQALCPAVYRFLPVLLKPDDLARVHGTNERVAVEDYRRAVRFYVQLLRRAAL
jgi:carboxypeptidase PM20D1